MAPPLALRSEKVYETGYTQRETRTYEWTDERMDGWTDGRTDGRTLRRPFRSLKQPVKVSGMRFLRSRIRNAPER